MGHDSECRAEADTVPMGRHGFGLAGPPGNAGQDLVVLAHPLTGEPTMALKMNAPVICRVHHKDGGKRVLELWNWLYWRSAPCADGSPGAALECCGLFFDLADLPNDLVSPADLERFAIPLRD